MVQRKFVMKESHHWFFHSFSDYERYGIYPFIISFFLNYFSIFFYTFDIITLCTSSLSKRSSLLPYGILFGIWFYF